MILAYSPSRSGLANRMQRSALSAPLNAVRHGSLSPSWPAVASNVSCTSPSESASGEDFSCSQNRSFMRARYFTFLPICGGIICGSAGSNSVMFHTDGVFASTTSSQSSARPSRHVTRIESGLSTTLAAATPVTTFLLPISSARRCASCVFPPLHRHASESVQYFSRPPPFTHASCPSKLAAAGSTPLLAHWLIQHALLVSGSTSSASIQDWIVRASSAAAFSLSHGASAFTFAASGFI